MLLLNLAPGLPLLFYHYSGRGLIGNSQNQVTGGIVKPCLSGARAQSDNVEKVLFLRNRSRGMSL